MKHGHGGYVRGCRCEECLQGHREQARNPVYRARENERKRLKNAARTPEQVQADRARERERYATKRRPIHRARQLRKQYGITPEEYDVLLKLQDHGCAICRISSPGGHSGPQRGWHVDHDHATGRIRGLLCTNCNSGLGRFKDDPEFLRAAARYLTGRKE